MLSSPNDSFDFCWEMRGNDQQLRKNITSVARTASESWADQKADDMDIVPVEHAIRGGADHNIQVLVRVRPPNSRELEQVSLVPSEKEKRNAEPFDVAHPRTRSQQRRDMSRACTRAVSPSMYRQRATPSIATTMFTTMMPVSWTSSKALAFPSRTRSWRATTAASSPMDKRERVRLSRCRDPTITLKLRICLTRRAS